MSKSPRRSPVTPHELQSVSERLHKRLDEEVVLTFPAVQYSLSETGLSSARIDPRQLRAALNVLANNPSPGSDLKHGPWEPIPGIYVAPNLTRTDAKKHAEVVAATAEDAIREMAARLTCNRAIPIAKTIAGAFSLRSETVEVDAADVEPLAAGISWNAAGARVELEGLNGGPPLSLWITNNLHWVFPDDFRLWRHLIQADADGAYPVVVGRKLPVATFTLLKRIGAFGVQLHHLYTRDWADSGAVGKAFAHGPPTMEPDEVQDHRAVHDYLRKVIHTPPSQTAKEQAAIRMAARLGLHLEDSGGLPGLREWSKKTEVELPVPWKAQLTRYERWTRAEVPE